MIMIGVRGPRGPTGKEGEMTMIRDSAVEPQPPADPAEWNQDHDSARWQPLLSVDEERELAERIKGGDQAARRQLILANLRLVVRIARRYKFSKLSLDDLVQEGNLGLIRASEDFDPSVHDCRFYTYAEIWIKAFLSRALIANDSLIRLPQHVFLLRKRHRRTMGTPGGAEMAGDESAETEPPSVEEIVREIGGTARRLERTRPFAFGLDTHLPVGEEDAVVPLTEAIVDNRAPDQEAADQEQRLLLEVALRRLNPFEAWVIRERYGLCMLIDDEQGWSSPNPRAARRDEPEHATDPQANPRGGRRAYFHRSYAELERDCGLTYHRIHQAELLALEKLRAVLGPYLARAV
jgi:RNA polymerase sigma factor (sigma-70 family)